MNDIHACGCLYGCILTLIEHRLTVNKHPYYPKLVGETHCGKIKVKNTRLTLSYSPCNDMDKISTC